MSYIASYIIIWWLLFFIALPISIKEKETSNKDIYKKEVIDIKLVKKLIIVTIISIPTTYGFVYYFNKYLLQQISIIM